MAEISTPGAGSAEPAPLEPSAEAAGATTLRRNTLTLPEVLAQSVANMSPTGAMALLPLLIFISAGNGTWFTFIIATILMVCVGYCCAQFSRRANSAGSFYVWVTQGLGTGSGHTAGWALQLGYIVTGVATILGFGIFGADFLNRISGGAIPADNRWVLAVLFLVDFFVPLAVAIMDMRLSARTSLTLESISVLLILILCVAIWVHKGSPIDTSQFSFSGVSGSGLLIGTVLAIFAYVGFESAGSLGMEARNPYRTIGQAILSSSLIVGLFYVVVSYSQTFGFEGTKDGFAKSLAPLPDLANVVGLNFLAPVMDIAIVLSLFACTLACINASARIAFAMAHDGMGVPALTRAHDEHRTPHIAIWVVSVPMVVVAVLPVLIGADAVTLTGWVGTVATFGFMLAYALVALAAPVFLNRIGVSNPLAILTGAIGVLSMAFIFWANSLPQFIPGGAFPALSGVPQWLPVIFLAWVAIGLVWYFVVRARNPELVRQMGSRFEKVA
ncbi:MAG TPA: APC family permease [Candidatus Dormibacteraeota bacterium]|nr:APC family permease [Candidatus Dormibacteraeota bacterium]